MQKIILVCFALFVSSGLGCRSYTQPEKDYAVLDLEYVNIGAFPDGTKANLGICDGAGKSCRVFHCATVGESGSWQDSGSGDYTCKSRIPAGRPVTLKPFVNAKQDSITGGSLSMNYTTIDTSSLSCNAKPIAFEPVEGKSYALEYVLVKDLTDDTAEARCSARLK